MTTMLSDTNSGLYPSRDRRAVGQVPLTRHALNALEQSAREAEARESKNIETEDLLLGLLKDKEAVAAKVLSSSDIDYQKVQDELKNM